MFKVGDRVHVKGIGNGQIITIERTTTIDYAQIRLDEYPDTDLEFSLDQLESLEIKIPVKHGWIEYKGRI